MKNVSLLARLRAAYALSNAINAGTEPDERSLNSLGLDKTFAKNFKR
ncbi:MAG: hypothetical protein ABJM29_17635 [Rhizobiaceae bacterium]